MPIVDYGSQIIQDLLWNRLASREIWGPMGGVANGLSRWVEQNPLLGVSTALGVWVADIHIHVALVAALSASLWVIQKWLVISESARSAGSEVKKWAMSSMLGGCHLAAVPRAVLLESYALEFEGRMGEDTS